MPDLVDKLRATVRHAQQEARDILNDPDTVVLDTETTGLDGAFIVDLAIIRRGGTVFNTLVNPQIHIPADASRIHGIYDRDVKKAPTFDKLWDDGLEDVLRNRRIVIYNAPYDMGVIRNEIVRLGVGRSSDVLTVRTEDALRLYQTWYFGGLGSSARGQTKLTTAHCDSPKCVADVESHAKSGAHRAYADCHATVERLRMIASSCWLHDHHRKVGK